MSNFGVWVPKGANIGSERCEYWFRKVRPENRSRTVPDKANFSVPDRANLPYAVAHESAA